MGYCLTCAKELKIKPVEDLISKMGISDEDLENVQDQMNSLMQGGDINTLMEQLGGSNLAEQMENFAAEAPGSDDDDFSHGAPAFPNFFNNIFGGGQNGDQQAKSGGKQPINTRRPSRRNPASLTCDYEQDIQKHQLRGTGVVAIYTTLLVCINRISFFSVCWGGGEASSLPDSSHQPAAGSLFPNRVSLPGSRFQGVGVSG